VSNTGQLGTLASSERFKKDIAAMEKTSEAVLALRPVTFHYKTDASETPQFGLVAEEAAKVDPALVLPDKQGKPYTVRYEAVNAMLLNEFLKEHRKVEQLEKQIEALTAGLQKVSAQLEANKPAPQVVAK
jgi:Chaperone of endosialidase